MLRSFVFGATLAVLTVSALAITTGDASATTVVPISGKYSKLKLDGICAREGGQSYGTADTAYGCTKGSNTVECDKKGNCKGYVARFAPSGSTRAGSIEGVLQMQLAPTTKGVSGGVTGGAATVSP